MEKLVIDSFLDFKKLEIDVKKFTILIGQQASGKSLIAKLTYFFKTLLPNHFLNSIENDTNKRDLDSYIL